MLSHLGCTLTERLREELPKLMEPLLLPKHLLKKLLDLHQISTAFFDRFALPVSVPQQATAGWGFLERAGLRRREMSALVDRAATT